MADQKISELTALTGVNLADVDAFAVVDTSAVQTKKITYGELKTALDTGTGFVRITGDTMTGALGITQTGSASTIPLSVTSNLNSGQAILELRSTGNSNSTIDLRADGTGDPRILFDLNGATLFAIGIDNSDGNKFKISANHQLGTNPRLTIDSSGNSTFSGTVTANAGVIVDNITIDGNDISTTNSNGTLTITPNGTGDLQVNSDRIKIRATEGESAAIMLAADEQDDNGDSWTVKANTDNTFVIQNDISGSADVTHFSITPNATVADSVAAFAGKATFAGTVTATTLIVADGTNSAPSITNTGDTNTGMYFSNSDAVSFTAGGVERLSIDSNSTTVKTDELRIPSGSESSPSLTRQIDPDTGLYFPNTNQIALTSGGSRKMNISTSSIYFYDKVTILDSASSSGLTIESTDAGSSGSALDLELYRNSSTPANNDYLGRISFNGEDSSGNKQNYVRITSQALNVASSAEKSNLQFQLIDSANSGSFYTPLNLEPSATTITGQLFITSASTEDTVTLTRSTNSQNNMLKFKTANVTDWIVGERNDSTSDFRIYSGGTGLNVLTLARATNAATFAGTVTASGLDINGVADVSNTLTAGALSIPSQGFLFNQAFGTGVPTIAMTGTANNGRGGAILFKESDGSGGSIANTAAIYSTDGAGGNATYGGLTLATYQGDMKLSTGGLASPRITILSGGNVGIGTDNPSNKLDIKGTVGFEATNSTNKWLAYTYTDNTLRFNYNGSGADELVIDTSGNTTFAGQVFTNVIGRSNDTNTTIDFPGSDVIQMYTNGVPRFDINSAGAATFAGSVTSGAITSSGSLKATDYRVNEGNSLAGGIFKEKNLTGSGSSLDLSFFAEGISNGGDIHFMTGGSATPKMTINSSGNVLVGMGAAAITSAGFIVTPNDFMSYTNTSTDADDRCLVLNRQSADGTLVEFRKANASVGSIGTSGNQSYIHGAGTDVGLFWGSNNVYPYRSTGLNDATIDLGQASKRFKDLYLSGTAKVGGDVEAIGTNSKIMVGESTAGGLFGHMGWDDALNSLYLGHSYGSAFNKDLVIDGSGNVGIGATTGMAHRLNIRGFGSSFIHLGHTGTAANTEVGRISSNTFDVNNASYSLAEINFVTGSTNGSTGGISFRTNSVNSTNTRAQERMSIDSAGNVGIGIVGQAGVKLYVDAPSSFHAAVFRNVSGGYAPIIADNIASSGTRYLVSLRVNNVEKGKITSDGSTVTYATSSDYRLKENVSDMTGATARLKQLKPKRFDWIGNSEAGTQDGFLAHEVSSVVPEAITGTKDAVDGDGNPDYQGIDQSKLVPLLVKTIQELEARITALEA